MTREGIEFLFRNLIYVQEILLRYSLLVARSDFSCHCLRLNALQLRTTPSVFTKRLTSAGHRSCAHLRAKRKPIDASNLLGARAIPALITPPVVFNIHAVRTVVFPISLLPVDSTLFLFR